MFFVVNAALVHPILLPCMIYRWFKYLGLVTSLLHQPQLMMGLTQNRKPLFSRLSIAQRF
jgi:hypothetical protein